jgi:hypothetical protein
MALPRGSAVGRLALLVLLLGLSAAQPPEAAPTAGDQTQPLIRRLCFICRNWFGQGETRLRRFGFVCDGCDNELAEQYRRAAADEQTGAGQQRVRERLAEARYQLTTLLPPEPSSSSGAAEAIQMAAVASADGSGGIIQLHHVAPPCSSWSIPGPSRAPELPDAEMDSGTEPGEAGELHEPEESPGSEHYLAQGLAATAGSRSSPAESSAPTVMPEAPEEDAEEDCQASQSQDEFEEPDEFTRW